MFRYTHTGTGEVLEFEQPQPAFAHDWWKVEEVDGEPSDEPRTVDPPPASPGAETGADGRPAAPDPLPDLKPMKRPDLEKVAASLGIEDADKIPNAPKLVEAIKAKHAELTAAAA